MLAQEVPLGLKKAPRLNLVAVNRRSPCGETHGDLMGSWDFFDGLILVMADGIMGFSWRFQNGFIMGFI